MVCPSVQFSSALSNALAQRYIDTICYRNTTSVGGKQAKHASKEEEDLQSSFTRTSACQQQLGGRGTHIYWRHQPAGQPELKSYTASQVPITRKDTGAGWRAFFLFEDWRETTAAGSEQASKRPLLIATSSISPALEARRQSGRSNGQGNGARLVSVAADHPKYYFFFVS